MLSGLEPEANFLEHVNRKSECSLFQCIDRAWRSFADHVRSLVHAHVRTGKVIRDTEDHAWESQLVSWYRLWSYQQAPNCEQLRCGRG